MSGTVDTSNIENLNDADIIKLEAVIKVINERQGKILSLDAFRREILERFHTAGFLVDVKTWTTDQASLYAFDIEIKAKLEGEFDPDQMVYEATHDVLDIGEKGVIGTKGLLKP